MAATFLALATTPVVLAQPTSMPVIETMQVDVWPEYDRPAALVMYRFRVSPTTSLDAPVPIPIPAAVGEPHAVAWRDVQGALLIADYVRRIEGDRAMILARLGSYEGQLEFYADIAFADRARTFRFQWPGGVGIGALSFEIQQPSGATELAVEPEPSGRRVGGDGLNYVQVELGRQAEGATPTVAVTYEKDSDRLTEHRPPSPSTARTPTPTSTSPPLGADSSPVWLFVVAGVLFGAGAGWLAWSYLGARADEPSPPAKASKAATPSPSGDAAPFCHECGTRTKPEATFCMECGTRLMKKPVKSG